GKITSVVLTPALDTLRSLGDQVALSVVAYIDTQRYDGGEYTWERSDSAFLYLATGSARVAHRLRDGTEKRKHDRARPGSRWRQRLGTHRRPPAGREVRGLPDEPTLAGISRLPAAGRGGPGRRAQQYRGGRRAAMDLDGHDRRAGGPERPHHPPGSGYGYDRRHERYGELSLSIEHRSGAGDAAVRVWCERRSCL